MFEGLLNPGWNIYAVTSANKFENALACYCNSEAIVN